MNIFDSEPCDDNLQKFRITCGEVYILTNIIDSGRSALWQRCEKICFCF